MDQIVFYKTDDEYGIFSNFSKHPIWLEHRLWKTAEHFFQSRKFKDVELQSEIHRMNSPMEAAKFGRRRDLPLRDDWDLIKDDIMRQAVEAKIKQHADVRELLLTTGNKLIIEHTKNDSYWADGGDGSGKNMLGKILMELREKYRGYNDMADIMNPPWIQFPEIKRRSIGWRMGYGEGYLLHWTPWFNGLSKASRELYIKIFPELEEWQGFYDELEDWKHRNNRINYS